MAGCFVFWFLGVKSKYQSELFVIAHHSIFLFFARVTRKSPLFRYRERHPGEREEGAWSVLLYIPVLFEFLPVSAYDV